MSDFPRTALLAKGRVSCRSPSKRRAFFRTSYGMRVGSAEHRIDSFRRKNFDMTSSDLRAEQLVQRLRRALPLTAHGRRPSPSAALRRRLPGASRVPRVTVIDVFDAGEEDGLMRRVDVGEESDAPIVVVAPIAQLAFNRRHPLAHDVAVYRKRRAEATALIDRGSR